MILHKKTDYWRKYLMRQRIMMALTVFIIAMAIIIQPMQVRADSTDNAYYLGTVQTKDDAGYGKDKNMKDSDVHYGWDLGQFRISGFTRTTKDEDGNPVFLKSVGDKVQLTFELEQDIAALNGDDSLVISNDDNGYDEYFGITKDERTNFGKGTLLVKYTDYQNKSTYVEPYTNYLKGVEKGATTEVLFYEEGDYEIALDYEIHEKKLGPDGYTHYQMLIKFSVRNGNCMVYPFDVTTGSELVNTSFTENGFYLDLAKSRYLTIDVKKQNYVEANGSLVEDTRFNKAASDGEKFTDPGVYVITVKNLYTKAETEKKIYVGSDPVLKAYVTTGKDIDYIKEMLAEGATIEEDGTITLPTWETVEQEDSQTTEKPIKENDVQGKNTNNMWIVVLAAIAVLVVFVLVKALGKKKPSTNPTDIEDPEEQGSDEEMVNDKGDDE